MTINEIREKIEEMELKILWNIKEWRNSNGNICTNKSNRKIQ